MYVLCFISPIPISLHKHIYLYSIYTYVHISLSIDLSVRQCLFSLSPLKCQLRKFWIETISAGNILSNLYASPEGAL